MIRLEPLDAIILASKPNAPARLVARPHGVAHVYTGKATPTGAVPRGQRPVCGARTRRLYPTDSLAGDVRRSVCARCSARLPALLERKAAEHPTLLFPTVADDRRRYTGLTVVDIYLSVRFAETLDELDECSLALELAHDPATARAENTSPTGRVFSDLPQIIARRRAQMSGPESRIPVTEHRRGEPAYWDAVHIANRNRRSA